MPLSTAGLRFPHERVLLPRTKLAYVHLRNLLTDAKRDRTARVSGYVAIWLADELVLLYLRSGEVVNATASADGVQWAPLAISEALGKVPPEPELGEICFHKAADEQLACMHQAQLVAAEPWPEGLDTTSPTVLFPLLKALMFDGVVEFVIAGRVSYLVFGDGAVQRGYLSDERHGPLVERVPRLFAVDGRHAALRARRWPSLPALPVQASPALIQVYREVVTGLVQRLADAGSASAPVIAECSRQLLSAAHPALGAFATDARPARDPVIESGALTVAVAAWVSDVLISAAGDEALAPDRLLREVTRERRHLLQAAGFYDALAWSVTW